MYIYIYIFIYISRQPLQEPNLQDPHLLWMRERGGACSLPEVGRGV